MSRKKIDVPTSAPSVVVACQPEPTGVDAIRSRILTIRGVQVILDHDLAELYGVPTKRLNEQVKRNAERFPSTFMFHLVTDEMRELVANCDRFKNMKHSSVPMTAFTEHGIIMLASVLKSRMAIEASIRITNTFVAMRKALASIAPLLARIEATDRRQIADQAKNDANQERNEERFKLILDAMRDKKFPPQKVFYGGQIYDAFEQMKKFVRMAKNELIIIDPCFDDCVLPLVAQKRQGVSVLVVKNSRNRLLHAVDVTRFNAQYGNSLTVKVSDKFHDRFLITVRDNPIGGGVGSRRPTARGHGGALRTTRPTKRLGHNAVKDLKGVKGDRTRPSQGVVRMAVEIALGFVGI